MKVDVFSALAAREGGGGGEEWDTREVEECPSLPSRLHWPLTPSFILLPCCLTVRPFFPSR